MRLTHLAVTGLCVALTVSMAMAKDKKAEKQMDPQAMMEAYDEAGHARRTAQAVCKSGRQLDDQD